MKVLDFSGIKLKFLGHSSFKMEIDQKIIYIDPWESPDHEQADIIFITHGHYDHCSINDLKKLEKSDTLIITTPDTTSKLASKVHVGDMKLVKPYDKFDIGDINVKCTPAYNINKEFHPKANEWVGYLITINNIKFYFSGDTDLIPEMKEVDCDVAILPVSGTYVMDYEEAAQAAKLIVPKVAIPCHYGKIIGSIDDAKQFKEKCSFCRVEIMDE